MAECAEALWRPAAEPIRRWLTEARGLPEDLLRLHRVGADLGARQQGRPEGLPPVRQAAVLPVLVDGLTCYVQLRVLGGYRRGPKYLNPAGDLAANPRLGFYGLASDVGFAFPRRELIVAEGIIDALSAAAGGYRAAAVLSASYADPGAAATLVRRPEPLVVAFDPDPAGRAGAERLVRFLSAQRPAPGAGSAGAARGRPQRPPREVPGLARGAGRARPARHRPSRSHALPRRRASAFAVAVDGAPGRRGLTSTAVHCGYSTSRTRRRHAPRDSSAHTTGTAGRSDQGSRHPSRHAVSTSRWASSQRHRVLRCWWVTRPRSSSHSPQMGQATKPVALPTLRSRSTNRAGSSAA